jgi:hypothetical protein
MDLRRSASKKITFFPPSANETARLKDTTDLPSLGRQLVKQIDLISLPQN